MSIVQETITVQNNNKSWIIPVLLFFFTLLWFGFWASFGVDPHHDGIVFKAAADVAHGQTLYSQTYTHYGILTVFLQAATLYLFGTKLLVLKYMTVVFYAMSAVAIYWISKRFLSNKFVWIPLLLFYLQPAFYTWEFQAWSSVYALFFSLVSCLMIIHAVDTPNKKSLFFWSGVLSIIPFWFRQPAIVFIIVIPVVVCLSCLRRRTPFVTGLLQILFYTLGIVAVCIPIISWILYAGVWSDFVSQTITGPLQYATTASTTATTTISGVVQATSNNIQPESKFVTLLRFYFWGNIGGFYYVLMWNIILWFCYALYRFWRENIQNNSYLPLLTLILFAGLSIHQFYPVPCPRHFYWGGLIGFILFGITIERLFKLCSSNIIIKTAGILFAIGLFLLPIVSVAKNVYSYYSSPMAEFYFPCSRIANAQTITASNVLQGIKVHKELYNQWTQFFKMVDSIPEGCKNNRVFNFTREGIYPLFFNNLQNYGCSFVLFGQDQNSEIRDMISQNDSIVIFYWNGTLIDFLKQNQYTIVGPCNIPPANHSLENFKAPCLYIAYREKLRVTSCELRDSQSVVEDNQCANISYK